MSHDLHLLKFAGDGCNCTMHVHLTKLPHATNVEDLPCCKFAGIENEALALDRISAPVVPLLAAGTFYHQPCQAFYESAMRSQTKLLNPLLLIRHRIFSDKCIDRADWLLLPHSTNGISSHIYIAILVGAHAHTG